MSNITTRACFKFYRFVCVSGSCAVLVCVFLVFIFCTSVEIWSLSFKFTVMWHDVLIVVLISEVTLSYFT